MNRSFLYGDWQILGVLFSAGGNALAKIPLKFVSLLFDGLMTSVLFVVVVKSRKGLIENKKVNKMAKMPTADAVNAKR